MFFPNGNAEEFCDHVFRTFDRDKNGFIDFKVNIRFLLYSIFLIWRLYKNQIIFFFVEKKSSSRIRIYLDQHIKAYCAKKNIRFDSFYFKNQLELIVV